MAAVNEELHKDHLNTVECHLEKNKEPNILLFYCIVRLGEL